jgi:hypothetical protein
MRHCLISLALLVSANAMAGCPALLDHTLRTLDERSQSLCEYAGNVLLVVNTASRCRTGRQVESFATRVEPNDPRLVATLERLLANHPEDPR